MMASKKVEMELNRKSENFTFTVGDLFTIKTDVVHKYPQQMKSPHVELSLVVIDLVDGDVIAVDEGPIVHRIREDNEAIFSYSPHWEDYDREKAKIEELKFQGNDKEEAERAIEYADETEIDEVKNLF